ncbi:hypothetical protein [Peribacillus deserti]|nr:hypothetical protein [Peribacillus deserti]
MSVEKLKVKSGDSIKPEGLTQKEEIILAAIELWYAEMRKKRPRRSK